MLNCMENRMLERLRQQMKRHEIDMYIVPTADFHQSEYVSDYFKSREALTGFTGSAGTAVVTQKEAWLFTDGRYFLQAEKQLFGSGFGLMKMGEPDTPSIESYVRNLLPEGGVLGFDGRCVGVAQGKRYEEIVEEKKGSLVYQYDVIDEIWESRPILPENPVFALSVDLAGESVASKVQRVRRHMQEMKTDALVITALEDLCWLLNIRGNDVDFCPMVLSYAIVRMDAIELYVEERKISDEIRKNLEKEGVHIYPYDMIYDRVKEFSGKNRVMLDEEQMNYALYKNLSAHVEKVSCKNPIILMKAIKNETEVENIRNAHIKDGVACTRFLYWLKHQVGKISMTEISAAVKLEEFREKQEGYLGASFAPISAYKEHAAIVHYSADTDTDKELDAEGMLLMDTGGHYREGSTDITRTIALGAVSKEEKQHFTMTLVGMLRLSAMKFLYGCTGMNLDCIARAPFWEKGLNFNHGTGHGVGYYSNIHEPPVRFHWKYSPSDIQPLEENMVITDEPGIYIEGSHGIRIENELLVRKGIRNQYGQFMQFDTLTLVPIDRELILLEEMDVSDRRLLNEYHRKVYKKIAPYLPEKEKEWLAHVTKPL